MDRHFAQPYPVSPQSAIRNPQFLRALPYLVANGVWLASGSRATRAFRRALREPRRAQETLLATLLRRNARADYGRRYRFERLRAVRDYQDAVPIVTYDDLEVEIAA